jgi:hypothetical protein
MLWPCTGREGEGWGGGGAAEAGDERWRVGEQEMVEKTKEIRKRERVWVLCMCCCYLCRDEGRYMHVHLVLPLAPLHS